MTRTTDPLSRTLDGLRGRYLLDASAGTGKTYAITGLVLRLLIERGLAIREILVVTYTEAATEDLRSRIREKIGQALAAFEAGAAREPFLARLLEDYPDHEQARRRLTEALYSFDEAPVSTIHGFCQRLLRDRSLESGAMFDSELVTDELLLVREVIEDFQRLQLCGRSRLFLQYAQSRFAPDRLEKLALAALHKPFLRIVPAPGGAAEEPVRAAEARFLRAFEQVRAGWQEAQPTVSELLLRHQGLNRTRYNPKKLPLWLEAMNALLGTPTPYPELFEEFERFTEAFLARSARKGCQPPAHPFFAACSHLHQAQQELLGQYGTLLLHLKGLLLSSIREKLDRRKLERNLLSFDDLLRGVHRGVTGPGAGDFIRAVRSRYPVALIDEFQDTDPLQYETFATIYRGGETLLFLIGDPKQAIYGFRGADIFAYLRAATEVDGHATLPVNYRSEPGLVQAINAVFERVSRPFVFEEIAFSPVKAAELPERPLLVTAEGQAAPFQLWLAERPAEAGQDKQITKEEARQCILEGLAGEVVRLLRQGAAGEALIGARPLTAGDLAVLVRTNREALLVQEKLRQCGVEAVLHSLDSVFRTREAEELHRVLAAVADPGDERLVRAALVTTLLGVDGARLAALEEDEAEWEEWLLCFREYQALWLQGGFFRMLRTLFSRQGVRARLLALPDGERRLTNVLHLAEALHREVQENGLGVSGVLKSLAEHLAAENGAAEEHQLRLESDGERVRIVTIHKAKGLQYPVVFCPFCWEGSNLGRTEFFFHAHQEQVLELGSEDTAANRQQARREELAENLRLLYVALTRAVHRCYLAWGPFSGSEHSAVAYLLHQGKDRSPAPDWEQVAGRVKSLSDEEIREEVEELVRQGRGPIALQPLPAGPLSRFTGPETAPAALACRGFTGSIRTDWKVTSFSALSHGGGRPKAAELPDRDSLSLGREVREPAAGCEAEDGGATIAAFPQGAGPGTFMHELLEQLDFETPDQDARRRLVQEKLRLHGFDRGWSGPVLAMLEKVLHTPLAPVRPPFMLAEVEAADRLHELEFHFPLASLTGGDLQALFESRQGPWSPDFPRRLGCLAFSRLRGFLKGFIDLVMVRDGRFYVVDWKSNYLGPNPAAYGPEQLGRVMEEQLYLLQYHLYVVAVHRYLAGRLPGYLYESHFGGVFYLFLRGMEGQGGGGRGIFFDLPRPDLVRALESRLLPAGGELG